jgi:phage terminase large subunit-like protein
MSDAIPAPIPMRMRRIVVAIDPATTVHEDSDETGIIVAGMGFDKNGYVLDDLTCKETPDGWARIAVGAYHRYKADRMIWETNQGGLMVERVIRIVDPNVSGKGVHACRGKALRAEPVAALYEKGRIFHVRPFPELEDEMLSFVPDDLKRMRSPNRVDALVYALTELFLGGGNYSPPMGGGSRPQIVVPSFRDHAAPSPRFSR